VAAIVFMLTSLTLAYMSGGKVTKSVVSDVQAPIEQPAQTDDSTSDAGTKSE
jgi:preprotein translocase subunit SecG